MLGNGDLLGLLTAGPTDSASPEGGSTCHGCLCPWRLVQARWGHSPKASRAQQNARTRAQKDHGERRVEALEHLLVVYRARADNAWVLGSRACRGNGWVRVRE